MASKIYYNPRHSLGYTGNTQALYAANVSPTWLQSQEPYTLHKPVRQKPRQVRAYKTKASNWQWQSDLVDMQGLSRSNKGHGYILTAIDVFSRYAWAVPIKTKHFENVKQGFSQIFSSAQSSGPPHSLQTDEGKEFINKNIQAFFAENGVKHFIIHSVYKAALVERFHRTLRSRMYRYFTHRNTKKWLDILPDLLFSYNSAKHSALSNFTPHLVYTDRETQEVLWRKQNTTTTTTTKTLNPPKFKIGDMVRLALTKRTFDHGYTPNWTRDLYEVVHVDTRDTPPMYIVSDGEGSRLDGKFYAEHLQIVKNPLSA